MLTSFVFGIIASITPCTIVLIPIFLYRFGMWGNKGSKVLYKELFLTLLGFWLSLFIVGAFFTVIFTSSYVNIIRFIIGGILILFGFLQLFGIYNFANSKKVNNPFLFGLIVPWFVSFSPCVIPFFGFTLTSGFVGGEIILNIFLFGLGLIIPSVFVAIIGDKFMRLLKKTERVMFHIEKYSGVLIILAGIYLNFQIVQFKSSDLYLVGAVFVFFATLALYTIFIKKSLINKVNIIMFLTFIVISYGLFLNCKNAIYREHVSYLLDGSGFMILNEKGINLPTNPYQCDSEKSVCRVCNQCSTLFSISVILGSLAFGLSTREIGKRKVK